MRVRDATGEDVDAIRRVHERSIRGLATDAYGDEQVDAWASGVESADYAAVDSDDYEFLVAETGDGVVAFGSLRLVPPDGYTSSPDAEVTGIYVHPDHTRRGVATALLTELETRAREHDVDRLGLQASRNAVSFYDGHDYQRVAVHDHEFSSHEDTDVTGTVVEMTKRLDGRSRNDSNDRDSL